MSSDFAICVKNITKTYQIYDKPQDRLKQSLWRGRKQFYREFKALDDVSIEVKKRETVGIIGGNGSGKSTLLQIICGTLAPTAGTVEVNGRVAALLELGSGFNPEFTGQENVYMNAAILGLSTEEIDAKYDEISAFADIGAFIDQPVKTYSSGMVVRLAFAVIAHVDADILVVDEALSVGDAVFTQKCMRFIRLFQERGTLLFVSHDMGAVQNLCRSATWLAHGKVQMTGDSKSVAEAYLQYTFQEVYGEEQKLDAVSADAVGSEMLEEETAQPIPAIAYEAVMSVQDNIAGARGWKTGAAELLSLTLEHLIAGKDGVFEGGEKVRMVIEAVAHQDLANPILGFIVKDRLGQDLFGENTLPYTTATTSTSVKAGQCFTAEFDFHLPMLPNGQYVVMASVADGDLYDNKQHHYLHDAYVINVSSSKVRWGLVGLPFERVSLEVKHDR